jgi:hypothetical protein
MDIREIVCNGLDLTGSVWRPVADFYDSGNVNSGSIKLGNLLTTSQARPCSMEVVICKNGGSTGGYYIIEKYQIVFYIIYSIFIPRDR